MEEQLRFDFGESAEAEESAARAARAQRLVALEAVASSLGWRWDEVGGRVLRALGHLCGSRRSLDRGYVGLRWVGTIAELASDAMVSASPARVRAVLAVLESVGVLSREVVTNFRGQHAGILVTLDMATVNRIVKRSGFIERDSVAISDRVDSPLGDSPSVGNRADWCPPKSPLECPPKSPLECPPTEVGIYIPRYSDYPKDPPPPSDTSTTASGGLADGGVDLIGCFRSIGVARAIPLAREFASRSEDVAEAIEVYRAQRSKFDGPGAVVEFLRSGAWPCNGVRSLEEIRRRRDSVARRIEPTASPPLATTALASGGWTEEERLLLRAAGIG